MADPVIEELLAAREHHRAIAPPSEQRRLALEDGAAGPEVRDAGPAEHEGDRADEHMHRTIMT